VTRAVLFITLFWIGVEGEWIHHERRKNAPIDKASALASRYIVCLERSVSGRIDESGEADSRAEPHVQEPPQCRQKLNVDWRFGAKRQK
jgi:hypothetical protein